jgi:RNA polymerase sigma factor (sigma-70 family)
MATGLGQVLQHLQRAGGGQTDGQLLARFAATRDEASFAALVRRHGPMVLGVCRRVLGHFHDAEDAFQATFLVLATKAASVVKRESVSCWLHGVAYHTALRAGAALGRRRARERQVDDMPHPQVMPAEAQDWLPLLDRELNRLPEKYRAAIVLCDLEGRSRREAARLLRLPEGTLSSRLATGRQMLAKRLAGCGVALSGGALAVTLAQGTASAQVPLALAGSTVKASLLVAAGQAAGVSTPAAVLMKGVMKAMLLKKLRMAIGAVMVLVALGTVGIAYQAAVGAGAARAAPPDKPVSEMEALRKENELLKLNLQVVLEKVRAQENELQGLRKDLAASSYLRPHEGRVVLDLDNDSHPDLFVANSRLYLSKSDGTILDITRADTADPVKEAESALKALREAKDKNGKRRAADALEKATKKLRETLK